MCEVLTYKVLVDHVTASYLLVSLLTYLRNQINWKQNLWYKEEDVET